ncbi:thioredoxin family protein [Maribacter sp. MJ134]|uniref:thioredoxin family protein n=1 Tax=Maribacter sp. MJ134 TaxID=2496865 RepID=UPI001F4995BC|nr:thioredoxin family protein [Maribacter sp. MJ134]
MSINTMIRKEDTLVTALGNSYSYEEYRNLVEKLAAEGKSTGPVQTEALANYTQLNDRRMKRWDKTLRFSEEAVSKITAVSKKMTWTVLTESWCGDASPALPVMNKIAELNPNIELRVVLRDENTDLMNQFLTNGGMSIPKLIVRDDVSNEVVADWGPRSANATKLVEDHKAVHGMIKPEFKQDIQVWYNRDKGQSILADLLLLLPLE